MIKYYYKCVKWLWKNRNWSNTRQKYKAMERECKLDKFGGRKTDNLKKARITF